MSTSLSGSGWFRLVSGFDVLLLSFRRVVARGAQLGHGDRHHSELRQLHQLPHRLAQNGPRTTQVVQEVVPVRPRV